MIGRIFPGLFGLGINDRYIGEKWKEERLIRSGSNLWFFHCSIPVFDNGLVEHSINDQWQQPNDLTKPSCYKQFPSLKTPKRSLPYLRDVLIIRASYRPQSDLSSKREERPSEWRYERDLFILFFESEELDAHAFLWEPTVKRSIVFRRRKIPFMT